MPVLTLSQMLLHDVVHPVGLTPRLGEATRQTVLLEYLEHERRMVGEKLSSVEALAECLHANFKDYEQGRIGKDELYLELFGTLQLLRAELRYDELQALGAG